MKFWGFSASLLTLLVCGSAMAMEPLCPYYGGHVDVEGKYGSQRHIGETSVFLPLACTEDTLLFSDLRFKGDNQDNREGNVALGVRDLRENGVIGGYLYFDRKQSGFSEKYFSQVTLGSEWLAEDWEIRANGYVPLNDEREILTGESVLSDPFLAGTGIFTRETGLSAVRETPLYGGDIEAGFKIPGTDFWLHAAAFSFNAEDAPSLDGVRSRATFQITENIALTAEGQYDDERGRQGWVGARLTLPFGGPAQKPEGLKARMTASPVRDIDIVTQTQKTIVPSDRILPVLNTDSGNTQRVLYVDNSAAGGGNGSLNNPYNTLAAAQAALQDNDILYIAEGDGGTTGMQSGLTLTRQGVQVIGGGVDFVYDGNRFTTSSGNAYNGLILRAATAAPKITNTNIGGDGITVSASDIVLTGFAVENANRHGIYAFQTTGGALSNLALYDLSVTGSGQDGVRIEAVNAGSSVSAALANIATSGNRNGIRFYAANDASVSGSLESSITSANSQHGVIVYDDSAAGAVDVDMGGGGLSAGNNAMFGNTLEDLAVDIDGASLSAQNNWWGQANGADQDNPSIGVRPQIYYGAPMNDGLVGHWTFDSEWVSGTTGYDRSSNGFNATMANGLSAANLTGGRHRQAIQLTSTSNQYVLTPNIGTRLINESLTLMSWFNTNQPGIVLTELGQPVINTSWHDSQLEMTAGGNLRSRVWNLAGVNNGVAAFNSWNQGVTRYDDPSNALDGFLNGTEAATNIVGDRDTSGVTPGVIQYYAFGARDTTNLGSGAHLNGMIDDVRIYNRALANAEVEELYRMNTNSVVDVSGHRTTSP